MSCCPQATWQKQNAGNPPFSRLSDASDDVNPENAGWRRLSTRFRRSRYLGKVHAELVNEPEYLVPPRQHHKLTYQRTLPGREANEAVPARPDRKRPPWG
jgi:hypothetical protein